MKAVSLWVSLRSLTTDNTSHKAAESVFVEKLLKCIKIKRIVQIINFSTIFFFFEEAEKIISPPRQWTGRMTDLLQKLRCAQLAISEHQMLDKHFMIRQKNQA